jgi:uncharacterized membrane protein YkoI
MVALLKLIVRCPQGSRSSRSGKGWLLLRAVVLAGIAIGAAPVGAQIINAQTITADEAIARAQQQVPGKLVAVNKEQQGDQTVYRVRILGADGVVRTIFINAGR